MLHIVGPEYRIHFLNNSLRGWGRHNPIKYDVTKLRDIILN